ncbi:unnamed protein product [Arctia plantaginis]|uniref:Uncharacterized protein n=1 Tax=Arctia plantaginis TaxID=874455 RepID=A0A8S1BG61_ARCPL|nr:unnamed protein product [Arctia plantaginis]CAB3261626.1 unnamed protein product [Arctia plantaginis]
MCGCDCGGCGGIPFCTGNLFVIAERVISYVALTAVVCCIVILFAISLGIGIGLGYNYCVVDLKVQSYSQKPPALRSGSDESVDEIPNDSRRRLVSSSTSSATDAVATVTVTAPAVAADKYTLTLPLHGNMDFAALLAKLRARNKNITLELVT